MFSVYVERGLMVDTGSGTVRRHAAGTNRPERHRGTCRHAQHERAVSDTIHVSHVHRASLRNGDGSQAGAVVVFETD